MASVTHIARQREKLLMVDLCCGFGGASKPARDRGWVVYTLDIAGRVKPDIVGDLSNLPLRRGLRPDLLWVSWPCIEYTRWALPWLPDTEPTAAMMHAAIRARDYLRPHAWVFENTPASVAWCAPALGAPRLKTWGHVFWSNMFVLLPQVRPHKTYAAPNSWRRPYIRSIIPYEIAHAFVVVAERRAGQIS